MAKKQKLSALISPKRSRQRCAHRFYLGCPQRRRVGVRRCIGVKRCTLTPVSTRFRNRWPSQKSPRDGLKATTMSAKYIYAYPPDMALSMQEDLYLATVMSLVTCTILVISTAAELLENECELYWTYKSSKVLPGVSTWQVTDQ